jgi:hypothetical protein
MHPWSTIPTASSMLQQKAAEMMTKRLLGSSAMTPTSVTAMITPGLRRAPVTTSTTRNSSQQQQQQTQEIWRGNFARLYARRMLELAALAAASQRFVSELEAAIDKPSKWKDWEYRDWTDDLLASLGTTKWDRFWTSARRIASLACLATPLAIMMPLSYVSETCHRWSWDYALWGIEQAGPTLIKLVQWATTRQDLFSPEFCLHFGKLRDETQGHSFAATQLILAEEFVGTGREPSQWLEMDPKPIGSGCIAQVYRGRLIKGTSKYPAGTEIAVKIQHPGIWHKVCVDFYLLAKVAKFLEGLPRLNLKYLSLADTVRQFRDIMLPQLDLRIEAANLQRFNQDFRNDDNVTFPHPITELTTSRVLTETFIAGTPIMEYTSAPADMRRQIAAIGLRTTLNMIFLKDFIHGMSCRVVCAKIYQSS